LYHTVHGNDKSIAVHWRSPRIVVVTRQLFYGEGSNGSSQELHIRYIALVTASNYKNEVAKMWRMLFVIVLLRDTATVTALDSCGFWAFNDSICEALFSVCGG